MVYYHNRNEILKHRKLIPNKSWSNMIYSMFNACGQTMLILRYDVFKRKMWPYGLCQNNGRFSFKTFFWIKQKIQIMVWLLINAVIRTRKPFFIHVSKAWYYIYFLTGKDFVGNLCLNKQVAFYKKTKYCKSRAIKCILVVIQRRIF